MRSLRKGNFKTKQNKKNTVRRKTGNVYMWKLNNVPLNSPGWKKLKAKGILEKRPETKEKKNDTQ